MTTKKTYKLELTIEQLNSLITMALVAGRAMDFDDDDCEAFMKLTHVKQQYYDENGITD